MIIIKCISVHEQKQIQNNMALKKYVWEDGKRCSANQDLIKASNPWNKASEKAK